MAEYSPEKAGVGGSIPSLATIFSSTYVLSKTRFCSILFQNQNLARRSLPQPEWIRVVLHEIVNLQFSLILRTTHKAVAEALDLK